MIPLVKMFKKIKNIDITYEISEWVKSLIAMELTIIYLHWIGVVTFNRDWTWLLGLLGFGVIIDIFHRQFITKQKVLTIEYFEDSNS